MAKDNAFFGFRGQTGTVVFRQAPFAFDIYVVIPEIKDTDGNPIAFFEKSDGAPVSLFLTNPEIRTELVKVFAGKPTTKEAVLKAVEKLAENYFKSKKTPIKFKPPAVIYNSTDPFSREIFDGTKKTDGESRNIIVRNARKGRNGKGDVEELRATLQWFMKETSNTPALSVLDEESRRVYFATATLYAEGNEVIPLTQIGKLAGYKDYKKQSRQESIRKILSKASSFEMEINNAQEDEAYHRRTFGKVSRWRGQLIYYDYIENVEIRGQLTTGIRILQTPICYQLAKFRNQITSLPVNAFILPPAPTQKEDVKRQGMKSNTNAAIIGEYLLGRIKAKGTSNIIKKDSIYEIVEADTKQKRYKAKLKIIALLKDYQEKGIIISFTEKEKEFTFERVKGKNKK